MNNIEERNYKTPAPMYVVTLAMASAIIALLMAMATYSQSQLPGTEIPQCTPEAPTAGQCPPSNATGRMTGGGWVFTKVEIIEKREGVVRSESVSAKVSFGFELHCNVSKVPNNLQLIIHYENGTTAIFHLEYLREARCYDFTNIDPSPPPASLDTYVGFGVGRFKPRPDSDWTSANIVFFLRDAGEPGANKDLVGFRLSYGSMVIIVPVTKLGGGNVQAHPEDP